MAQDSSSRLLILGFPRSGTTLLSRLLDAHPDISCPPETNLMSSAARFLAEQSSVEGPPIGVLSGLEFLGIPGEDLKSALRALVFGMHERIANGAPVWVEKTAVDVFHLEKLEELLAGHARFIVLVRNPLDVIASNMDLSKAMGAWLDDLHQAIRSFSNPHIGLAHAWVERNRALDDFTQRNAETCYRLRYEDLTAAPQETLSGLLNWIGVAAGGATLAERALTGQPRIGLGDFRINTMSEILPADPKAWRSRLPPASAARVLPIVAQLMKVHGYDVPKIPPSPTREDAIRQFQMAAQIKRDTLNSSTD
ncbi:sulfotransferase [uncultured Roseobacter sp.]|uniref:sulfotransferase family protein n=1 Tax=uncultured Roseobacter sp. TaxID=114847 RepID=UPI002620A03B|nr:sulfotransferase [uncultured Roseobacter sp.]